MVVVFLQRSFRTGYRSSAGPITIIPCVSSSVIDELLKISHVINLKYEMNKSR
ncbi:hypothetical protein J7297_01239 [Nakaseomyces glabratus]|nr:hypothetical protein J7297_01239 [Nakaseomyces glabratus]KAH7594461.1 hypothetical protein J7296_01241 [Nakaseomyces glabratus]